MSDSYTSTTTPAEAAAWLRGARSVAITTHYKPDGDAVGSSLALARALALANPEVRVELWYAGPLPDFVSDVVGETPFRHLDTTPPTAEDRPDALVITDTGAWSQLEFVRGFAESRAGSALILDHHLHGDPEIAERRVIDTSAPAAAQIAADVCAALLETPVASLPVEVATPIFLGLATDTGWFRFSNVTPGMFRLVADLIESGVPHTELYRLIEQRDRVSRLRLFGRAMDKLEMHKHGQVALVTLGQEDYKASGAGPGDTGGFADRLLAVDSVTVAAILSEATDHEGKPVTKISFRSKPGKKAVDVNAVAATLGGGGHARAAGARSTEGLAETRIAVLRALGVKDI